MQHLILCLGLTVVCLAGLACAAEPRAPEPAMDDAPQQTELQAHDGYEGRWLRSEHAEVFVAVRPTFRLLAFRRLGGQTMMASRAAPEAGVRLAYLEPIQVPDSFEPGSQPGQFVTLSERAAKVALAPAEAVSLRYEVRAELAEDRPALHLSYRLTNLADRPREYAAWSVTAFERRGRLVAPFGEDQRSLRQLVFSWWTALPQPGLQYGRGALVVDADAPLEGQAFKVGLNSGPGWVAMVRGRDALLSRAPRLPDAVYPEGDANLTMFQFDHEDKAWCELEQVGKLTRVAPGEAATLDETLVLLELEAAPAGPDELRSAVEDAMDQTDARR